MRSERATPLQWLVLILLVISICINYIDRGNLSVALKDISGELHLTPSQLGLLLSSFFWTYASMQIVAGWLIDRYNVYWVYSAGFLLWSLATAFTGAVSTFWTLFALRLLLGLGESVAYPSYSKILASSFAEKQRGLANAMIDAGSKAGPALGLLIGGAIISGYGWRGLFTIVGLASLVWLVPWAITIPRMKVVRQELREQAPGFLEISSRREAWGTFLGLFCSNYGWYFLLTWLPWYMNTYRGFNASYGSVPFWGLAATSLLGGWLSDLWIGKGATPNRVRKAFTVGGLILTALLLYPASLASNPQTAMGLLFCSLCAFGLFSSNVWAITQTLAGPVCAGKWTGMQNCLGNVAGVVAPWVTGLIFEHNQTRPWIAFAVTSLILLLGAFSFQVIVRRVVPLEWGLNVTKRDLLASEVSR